MTEIISQKGIILGATGFIGSILSKHLANSGNELILVGTSKEALSQLKSDIYNLSGNFVRTIEISKNNFDMYKFCLELQDDENEIDFCINTIGTQPPLGNFIDLDFEEWFQNFEVNLKLNARLLQFFVRNFANRGAGSAIVFSGGGSSNSRPQFSAYASGKTALVRLIEIVAQETLPFGVKINAIAPGVMPSKMQKEILANQSILDNSEVIKAKESLNSEFYDTKKITDLIDFLISDKSEGISGKLISADWDNWSDWPNWIDELKNSEIYTLRRITSKDLNNKLGSI
jgi:short-subunit dehydrogenase